jgi:hypothetical protein
MGTDILACSLILSLTTIAFFSNYKTWHLTTPPFIE